MQSINGEELFRIAKERNSKLGDTSALAGAKLASTLGEHELPNMKVLDHFTINRKNDFVLGKIGVPKDILPFKVCRKLVNGTGRVAHRMLHTPQDLPADKNFNFTSCAVVGSSGALGKYKYGKLIDKFGTVFRFNRAPTIGYEDIVGSKTTFRIQNPERQGFMEKEGEVCLIKGWAKLQQTIRKCPSISFSPQFNEYTRHYWAMYEPDLSANPDAARKAPEKTRASAFANENAPKPRHKMSTGAKAQE